VIVELWALKSKGRFRVPTKCPHCDASFKGDESALREWTHEIHGYNSEITEEGLERGRHVRSCDEDFTDAFWCTGCDQAVPLTPVKSRKKKTKP
jgi:hypothetical protein